MPKFNAIGYVCLSYSDNKEIESDSILNQKNLIKDFAKKQRDISLIGFKVDDGYSGIIFDRPQFKEMMRDIQDGKIDCVIVKDLSRLGRNSIDSGFYIEKFLVLYGKFMRCCRYCESLHFI